MKINDSIFGVEKVSFSHYKESAKLFALNFFYSNDELFELLNLIDLGLLPEEDEHIISALNQMFESERYLFSLTALELVKKIKFNPLPINKYLLNNHYHGCFLIDQKIIWYRSYKKNFLLSFFGNKPRSTINIQLPISNIDTLVERIVPTQDSDQFTNNELKELLELFFNAFMFFYCADPEIIELGGLQRKTTNSGNSYKNKTRSEIKVIDVSWNQIIVNSNGFDVRGHGRFQACGKRWQNQRLIWINPYRKSMYVRKGGGINNYNLNPEFQN